MRFTTIFFLIVLFFAPQGWGACNFDYDAESFLTLKSFEFDQNPETGWRLLAKQDGCKKAAAELISNYQLRHPDNKNARILRWHEGQLRAFSGDYTRAIALFSTTYNKPPKPFGWNFYVDASIAFLEGDRTALLQSKKALAALPTPKPPLWPLKDAKGNIMNISWPMNMHVVNNLLKCFSKPYHDAYSGCDKTDQ